MRNPSGECSIFFAPPSFWGVDVRTQAAYGPLIGSANCAKQDGLEVHGQFT